MKNFISITIITLLTIWFGTLTYAGETATRSAYKVTSYNLGAIIDNNKALSLHSSSNFQPLLITSTKSDILYNELEGTVPSSDIVPHTANISGVALSARFDASEKISLHGAFGVTRNLWTPDSINYENASSWEANLGIIYRLLNNLTYEMHFGYMDTGNLFTEHDSYSDVESIIMVSNKLTLSF